MKELTSGVSMSLSVYMITSKAPVTDGKQREYLHLDRGNQREYPRLDRGNQREYPRLDRHVVGFHIDDDRITSKSFYDWKLVGG